MPGSQPKHAHNPTRISVIVATYGRPAEFERCLRSLATQHRLPNEVIAVLRAGDDASAAVIPQFTSTIPIAIHTITVAGMVQAHNLGLQSAHADIISFIDDDAEAHPDWLARIESHFTADPTVGGVGGRDIIFEDGVPLSATTTRVGIIQWFGRVIGAHHLGLGPARRVHTLKGVNMSWRATAIAGHLFDAQMRGNGAQVNAEMAFSLAVHSRGWHLLYDPAVLVNHYPAKRAAHDHRSHRSPQALADDAHNFYLALRRHLHPGPRKLAALLYARWIGTRFTPGILRGLLSRLRRDTFGLELRSIAAQAWQDAATLTRKP